MTRTCDYYFIYFLM